MRRLEDETCNVTSLLASRRLLKDAERKNVIDIMVLDFVVEYFN
jgi:hypothetical protein